MINDLIKVLEAARLVVTQSERYKCGDTTLKYELDAWIYILQRADNLTLSDNHCLND